ncbi:MarR family winged helix-turn-helix transcriptional regulator [Paraburkholderia terrae]
MRNRKPRPLSSVVDQLAEVDEHPHPAELAGACLMPKPTVTLYAKRLEAAGYLKRELDRADLRRHRLTLTADGRKAMTRGMAMLATAFGEPLDRLNAAERQALHRLLERLASTIPNGTMVSLHANAGTARKKMPVT